MIRQIGVSSAQQTRQTTEWRVCVFKATTVQAPAF